MNTDDLSQLSFVTTPAQLREALGLVSERARTKVRTVLSEMDRIL